MNVSVNGIIKEQKDALISIADKAVWYDFGVYENIKVLQGKVMWPEMHIDRLFASAGIIGLDLGEEHTIVLQWVRQYAATSNLTDHIIKICAYGDPDMNSRATIYMFAVGLTFYPDQYYAKGVDSITFRGERHFPNAKSMDTLINFLAFRDAKKHDAFESILIDQEGNAREGSRSNLYIVEKGAVVTPPVRDVLEGVTRILVLKLLHENTIDCSEERISKERLLSADEIFITATSSNIMPVTRVDGHAVGNGEVGEVTKRIYQWYRVMQRNYIESYEKNI